MKSYFILNSIVATVFNSISHYYLFHRNYANIESLRVRLCWKFCLQLPNSMELAYELPWSDDMTELAELASATTD